MTVSTCPSCGLDQSPSNASCLRCKAPLAKWRAPIEAAALSREAWRALGLGFLLAAVLSAIPIIRFLFSPLITLTHELGHAAVAWLFGFPAVPAFDFTYGGGVTSIEEEQWMPVIVGVYALMAFAAWRARRHIPTVVAIGILAILYSWAWVGDWAEILILGMGHGTELVIAGVFLYRAMSGDSVLRVDERPAYAMAAFIILFHDAGFAWGLATDDYDRESYAEGKGGMLNDFTMVVIYLRGYVRGVTIDVIGRWMIAGCGLTVVAAWLAHRYQNRIAGWWDRAFSRAA